MAEALQIVLILLIECLTLARNSPISLLEVAQGRSSFFVSLFTPHNRMMILTGFC